jgi:superfamily II DNA or RNA helicase
MKLYPYQKETVDYIHGELMFGSDKILIESPISSGKTLIMISTAIGMPGSVVISLSISDLIPQFEETFKALGFDDYTVIKAGMDFDSNKRIIVAMEQTLIQRLDLLKNREIELLLVEEAHIRYQGQRFESIINALEPAYQVFFTGTPLSSANTQMEGFYEQYTTISINELIAQGKLAKPRYFIPKWSREDKYSPGSKIGTEYTNEDLAVQQTPEFIEQTVDSFMNNEHFDGGSCKSIWFCSSVEMAKKYEEELQKRGVIAFAYHGKMKKDLAKSIMHSFKTNEPVLLDKDINLFNYHEAHEPVTVQALISINKLAVGFSVTDVQVAVRTSSTAILSRHLQIDGRAIRKHEGKEFGYIMDVGQNVMRLGLITDEYKPLAYGTELKLVRYDIGKHLAMTHLALLDDEIITREAYTKAISAIKDDDRRLSKLTVEELQMRFKLTDSIFMLIACGVAFMDKVHCVPMNDRWGKPSRGYHAISYDKERGCEVEKPVVGFYNASTLTWLTDEAVALFEEHKDEPVLLEKWMKSYRTKIRSIVNNKKSIYSIKFFANYLREKYIEENQEPEIDVDEDEIPF